MAENPYQAPQTELSPIHSTTGLRLTGWLFLGLGAFFFLPLAIVPLVLIVWGQAPFWPAAMSAFLVIGFGALSIWVGNRFRHRANLPPSQWPTTSPVVAAAAAKSAYSAVGFVVGTAIAAPFILSIDPVVKLVGGAMYGGTIGALIGYLLGMRRRP